ncbi:zinc-dependent alcohol dehydrogenase [Vagococcus fluvialis]|uniref:zinc-dependent alcohol dehydrogenase n=1 Tax=Vagococcus fluvialis TaxID=2738 RepID=UPI003D1453C4
MKTMSVAVFDKLNSIKIEQHPIPTVTNTTILIKVDSCAICTWEQRVFSGEKPVLFPFIGGHEIAGKIIAIGKDIQTNEWQVGDKVVYGTNLACGHCYQCKSGNEQNCNNFNHSKQLPGLPYKGMGGLSSYLLVHPEHLFHYSNVSPEEASLTEPLSCVIHSAESANIQYGDFVLIIGCGVMGLLHLQIALKSGAFVILSDPDENRLVKATNLGAHRVVNPAKENLNTIINQLTNNQGVQIVFNTTPISKVAEENMDLIGNNGTHVLYSSFYPNLPIEIDPDKLHKKAIKLIGTANSNKTDFTKATRMISQGLIQIKPLISKVLPLSQVEEAFEIAPLKENYRIVINFREEDE